RPEVVVMEGAHLTLVSAKTAQKSLTYGMKRMQKSNHEVRRSTSKIIPYKLWQRLLRNCQLEPI
ncbi:MAG: hypothetical protein KAJ55_17140, partial [Anaerolineales bacterium]|nr:hypothetical protein [Anaerolineales bacterium]